MTHTQEAVQWHRTMSAADELLTAMHSKDGMRAMLEVSVRDVSSQTTCVDGPFTDYEYVDAMLFLMKMDMIPKAHASERSSLNASALARHQGPPNY